MQIMLGCCFLGVSLNVVSHIASEGGGGLCDIEKSNCEKKNFLPIAQTTLSPFSASTVKNCSESSGWRNESGHATPTSFWETFAIRDLTRHLYALRVGSRTRMTYLQNQYVSLLPTYQKGYSLSIILHCCKKVLNHIIKG